MITSLLFALSYWRFRHACREPLDAQAACLRRILRRGAHSRIGAVSGFARIARLGDDQRLIREFQEAVPIRTYAEMRDELDSVYAGDWRRLCPSRPIFFAMTAGSTGCYKYIPVTPEFRHELGAGARIFYGALEAAAPGLRRRKAQFLVGSAEGGVSPDGIPQGFASGFNYRSLPWLVRRRFILPYWIFTLEDVEERSYAAGRLLAGNRDLGALCAISPVNLINLRRALERNAERLFADIEAGTLTVRCRSAVVGEYRGRPDPALAEALQQAWQRDGELPNRLLFPSLERLVCWQGGNMSYYLDELDRHFGLSRHFEFPISASEGIFAIPHRPDRPGGILAVTSHFLEFLPEDAAAGASRSVRVDQLQVGIEYRLIVTNSGGLYRYDMEDIVRVTSKFRRTPVIEFVSKRDRRVSVANERITELDVTLAMQATSQATGRWYAEFLFVPCSDRCYRVVLDGATVEADEEATDGDAGVRRFVTELERQLRQAARGYDFEREDGLLEPLQVVVTTPGELRAYFHRRQNQLPLPNAQIKPMHLTNEFDADAAFRVARIYAA